MIDIDGFAGFPALTKCTLFVLYICTQICDFVSFSRIWIPQSFLTARNREMDSTKSHWNDDREIKIRYLSFREHILVLGRKGVCLVSYRYMKKSKKMKSI